MAAEKTNFNTHNYENIGNKLFYKDNYHITPNIGQLANKANGSPLETGVTEQQY